MCNYFIQGQKKDCGRKKSGIECYRKSKKGGKKRRKAQDKKTAMREIEARQCVRGSDVESGNYR